MAEASLIENVVENMVDMVGQVDAIIFEKTKFVNWVRNKFLIEKEDKEIPALKQLKERAGISQICHRIEKEKEKIKNWIR